MGKLRLLAGAYKPVAAICFVLATAWLSACSGPRNPHDQGPATEILPVRIGPPWWVREGDTRKFVGDSLFDYIDGGAEMYLKYGFVDVSVGVYRNGEAAVTVGVYRFTDSDRAFGMYATLRPDMPDTVALGAEGFIFGSNLIFVKGRHLVNVYGCDESDDLVAAVRSVASGMAGRVPGTSDKPQTFGLFPSEGRLPFTEKLYVEDFLGQAFLTDVYTVDYSRSGSRFTLFLSDDASGAKLDEWLDNIVPEYDPVKGYQHLPYDDSKYLLTTDAYHGAILAGDQQGRLVGIVGHRPEDLDILVGWLASLLGY
jgi:hypothetical protein